MKNHGIISSAKKWALVVFFFLALGAVGWLHAEDQKQEKPRRYMSADKCKSCHDAEKKGNQYGIWSEKKHSKAYENLGTEEAAKTGKERGVDNPQTSEKCLKCHVTAYEEPKDKKHEEFKPELGVQCDSCHGPGDFHVTTQTDILIEIEFSEDESVFGSEEDEKYKPLPEGEIIVSPDKKTCEKCHNQESPTMKEFNYEEQLKEIRHLDPRKKRE